MSHEKDVKLYVLYCVHKKLNNYCMGYSLLCLWLAYLVVSNHSTILSVRHLSDIIFEKLPMCRKNLPKSVLYYNCVHFITKRTGGGRIGRTLCWVQNELKLTQYFSVLKQFLCLASGESLPLTLRFAGDAGLKPGTSDSDVWCDSMSHHIPFKKKNI